MSKRMSLPRIGYTGFGSFLPDTVLSNQDLERMVDTSDEWIQQRTGIRTRRILKPDETILDMSVHAAKQALDDAGVSPEQVGDIRVGVNTWMQFPSLASQVQHALGCDLASAADVSAGCAGFIYGVEEAHNKILAEKLLRDRDMIALVIGVDALSHITDWHDRGTCVLFGDGAGAVVLQEVQEGGILGIHTHAQGRFGDLLYSDPVVKTPGSLNGKGFEYESSVGRPALHMNGPKVYSRAIESMVRDVLTVLENYNMSTDEPIGLGDIDYVYPHQANLRIIDKVSERLGLPLEKVYRSGVINYGNTSAASIPLGYVDNEADRTPGRLEVDVAFGAGFVSGAILRKIA